MSASAADEVLRVSVRELRMTLERIFLWAGVPDGLVGSVREHALMSAALGLGGLSMVLDDHAAIATSAKHPARLLDERSDCTVIDANGQHLWCIGATLLDLAIDAAGTATARIEAINVGAGEEAGVLAALAHRQAARVRIRRDPGAAAVTLEVTTTPPPCTLAGWDPVLHRVLREGLPVAATSWWTLHELSYRALSPDTIDSRRHAGPIFVAADGRIIGRPVDDDTDFALLGRTTA
jgi:hypothetical protein